VRAHITIILLFLVGCQTASQNSSSSFVEECRFFASYGSHTNYYALLSNGEYFNIERGHFGIDVFDHGKWERQGDALLLISNEHVHDITNGVLLISGITFAEKEELIELIEKIDDFLSEHAEKSFDRGAVAKIWRKHIVHDIYEQGIDIDQQHQQVERNSLAQLVELAKKSLENSRKNVFPMEIITKDGEVYLCEKDIGDFAVNSLLSHLEISHDEFFSSMGSTQPFAYHPEMNDVVVGDTDFPELQKILNVCHQGANQSIHSTDMAPPIGE